MAHNNRRLKMPIRNTHRRTRRRNINRCLRNRYLQRLSIRQRFLRLHVQRQPVRRTPSVRNICSRSVRDINRPANMEIRSPVICRRRCLPGRFKSAVDIIIRQLSTVNRTLARARRRHTHSKISRYATHLKRNMAHIRIRKIKLNTTRRIVEVHSNLVCNIRYFINNRTIFVVILLAI